MKQTTKELYAQFLLSTFGRHSALFLSELLENNPAHDSFTRWLSSTKLKPAILWEYVSRLVDRNRGFLIVDDSVLDRWYAKDIELLNFLYSGTHHKVVKGIGLVSLLWNSRHDPEHAEHLITDFRIYGPKYDGKDKHEHARDMLTSAHLRGFRNVTVLMDSWYGATKTLKLVDKLGWTFVTGIKSNRQVSVAHEYRSVADLATPQGVDCWMKAYGWVKVFAVVNPCTGDSEYLATNDRSLSSPDVRMAHVRRWKIEEYHRGAKQVTGLEKCQARNQRAQRNHILCSILAFLALEKWRLETGVSWYEAKQQLIAYAIKEYLKSPSIPLLSSA